MVRLTAQIPSGKGTVAEMLADRCSTKLVGEARAGRRRSETLERARPTPASGQWSNLAPSAKTSLLAHSSAECCGRPRANAPNLPPNACGAVSLTHTVRFSPALSRL